MKKVILLCSLLMLGIFAIPQSQFFMMMAETSSPDMAGVDLIRNKTVSGATCDSIDLTGFVGTYAGFKIEMTNVNLTNDGTITMTMSTDGGATWITTGYDSYTKPWNGNTTSVNTAGVDILLDMDGGQNSLASCFIWLPGVNVATKNQEVHGFGFGNSWRGGKSDAVFSGYTGATQNTDAVRFCVSAGTWSATVKVYGIK